MQTKQRICVFCASSSGNDQRFQESALQLARVLRESDCELVYGGGSVGLMGTLADEMLRLGGRVTGVIPQLLLEREVGHRSLSELRVVADMLERKALMAELSDASLALPGGYGTIDELFEMLTWLQLRVHEKPVGLLNIDDYYTHLLNFLDHAVAEGFLRREHKSLLQVDQDPSSLLQKLGVNVG